MIRAMRVLALAGSALAAEIRVDVLSGRKPISPHLYGRNNSLFPYPCNVIWFFA